MIKIIRKWLHQETGFAATEFALMFPVLFSLMVGTYDIGQAMIINQKVMSASQITADLIARVPVASAADVQEAIAAGRLALQPYDSTILEYDIVSIRFDGDGNPVEEGRETSGNYDAESDMVDQMNALANPGEGVLGVTMQYKYEPFFGRFIIPEYNMQEVAFARGRKSPVIYFQ